MNIFGNLEYDPCASVHRWMAGCMDGLLYGWIGVPCIHAFWLCVPGMWRHAYSSLFGAHPHLHMHEKRCVCA